MYSYGYSSTNVLERGVSKVNVLCVCVCAGLQYTKKIGRCGERLRKMGSTFYNKINTTLICTNRVPTTN